MDTKKLRQKILDLAIRGKLVPQDPNDEPASVLLERIRAEKEQLIKDGKIKRAKKSAASDKSHYENVPFELPKGWVWTTLGEISNYGECTNVSVDKISRESWVLELEDIEKDSGRLIQRRVKADRKINGVRHSFSSGCILYSKLRTYLNKVLIADQSGYCTTEIIPITCNKGVMPEYLCQVLRSNYFVDYTISLGYGVKMPRLGTADAIKSMIPLPPIHEQARIVALINRLATYIELLEANKQDAIEVANKIKSKILDFAVQGKLISQDPLDEPAIELLKRLIPQYKTADNRHYENVPYEVPESWQWVKLKDLCIFLSRGKSPVYSETDKRYPVFAQKCNLKGGGISLKEARFLEPSTISKWKDVYKLQDGDILINSTGTGTVCRTRLFKSEYLCDYPFVVPDSHVSVIRTYEQISSEYAYLVLSSKFSQDYMMDNLAGSTNQKELYISVLENLLFPLPPFGEQMRIVKCVNKIYTQLEQISSEL